MFAALILASCANTGPRAIRCEPWGTDRATCHSVDEFPCTLEAEGVGAIPTPSARVLGTGGVAGAGIALVSVAVGDHAELHVVASGGTLGPSVATVDRVRLPLTVLAKPGGYDIVFDGGHPSAVSYLRLPLDAAGVPTGPARPNPGGYVGIWTGSARNGVTVAHGDLTAECRFLPGDHPVTATLSDASGPVAGPVEFSSLLQDPGGCEVACRGPRCLFAAFTQKDDAPGRPRVEVRVLDLTPGSAEQWDVAMLPANVSSLMFAAETPLLGFSADSYFGPFAWVNDRVALFLDDGQKLVVRADDPRTWVELPGSDHWLVGPEGAEGYDIGQDPSGRAEVVRTTARCP